MSIINQKKTARLAHNSRAHPVFKKDWSLYDSQKFANTFLPYTESYQGTGTLVFDGAELFKNIPKAERNILELPTQQLIHSLIYTYPKGTLAETKKGIVQPSRNEICSFVEVNLQNIETNVYIKPVDDFKKYFQEGSVHRNHLLYVFDLLKLEEEKVI